MQDTRFDRTKWRLMTSGMWCLGGQVGLVRTGISESCITTNFMREECIRLEYMRDSDHPKNGDTFPSNVYSNKTHMMPHPRIWHSSSSISYQNTNCYRASNFMPNYILAECKMLWHLCTLYYLCVALKSRNCFTWKSQAVKFTENSLVHLHEYLWSVTSSRWCFM